MPPKKKKTSKSKTRRPRKTSKPKTSKPKTRRHQSKSKTSKSGGLQKPQPKSKTSKSKPSKPTRLQSAFVTLVMKNPHYVFGSLVMGHSLKLTKTRHTLVCMITDDLYDEYHELLSVVYDEVIKVPYLRYDAGRMQSQKQEEIYKEWIDFSFTKWNCLALAQYNKVCFLDADLIITRNIDHLMELKAPAAAFVNFWLEFGGGKKNYYSGIKFGETIPPSAVRKGLKNGFVLIGHCVVLEPSKKTFKDYIKFMSKYEKYEGCVSGADEKSITSFMLSIGKTWTQLDHMYNTISWHMKKTNIVNGVFKPPYILHFFNKEKPWISQRGKWSDTELWWQYYDSLKGLKSFGLQLSKVQGTLDFNSKSSSLPDFNIEKFNAAPKPHCAYCNFVIETIGSTTIEEDGKKRYSANHAMIKDGKIVCEKLLKLEV